MALPKEQGDFPWALLPILQKSMSENATVQLRIC